MDLRKFLRWLPWGVLGVAVGLGLRGISEVCFIEDRSGITGESFGQNFSIDRCVSEMWAWMPVRTLFLFLATLAICLFIRWRYLRD